MRKSNNGGSPFPGGSAKERLLVNEGQPLDVAPAQKFLVNQPLRFATVLLTEPLLQLI